MLLKKTAATFQRLVPMAYDPVALGGVFKWGGKTISLDKKDQRGVRGIRHVLRFVNLFTTIHDGNFRRHSSMNVTIK